MKNLNSMLLPAGGALLGYLASEKENSMRNALVGLAVGFGANWLMKPAAPSAESEFLEDLPPELVHEEEEEVSQGPPPIQTQDPFESPDYIPDDGSAHDWTGKDQFPVGTIARFQAPFATSRNMMAVAAVKMNNGNWVTQPGQEVYWTSIGNLARDPRVHVLDVVDRTETQAYWQVGSSTPLEAYP